MAGDPYRIPEDKPVESCAECEKRKCAEYRELKAHDEFKHLMRASIAFALLGAALAGHLFWTPVHAIEAVGIVICAIVTGCCLYGMGHVGDEEPKK